jgi:site-specific recombinase
LIITIITLLTKTWLKYTVSAELDHAVGVTAITVYVVAVIACLTKTRLKNTVSAELDHAVSITAITVNVITIITLHPRLQGAITANL